MIFRVILLISHHLFLVTYYSLFLGRNAELYLSFITYTVETVELLQD